MGELPREHYARLRAAGADRYLLRIESSNPELYASLHPPAQRWEDRVRCLRDLKDLGFMVGGRRALPVDRRWWVEDDGRWNRSAGMDPTAAQAALQARLPLSNRSPPARPPSSSPLPPPARCRRWARA